MGEERLQHATEAAIVEEILGTIRHDVRNKLAAVRQAAQYLKRKSEGSNLWSEDPRFAKFYALIDEQLVEADKLLVQHGSLERVYKRNPQPLDMHAVVRRAIAHTSLPHAVSVELAPGRALADEAEVVIGLAHLLDNAARVAPDGSPIRVLSSVAEGTYTLCVADEGPGMSLDDFRRLARGNEATPSGRGLGLAIARRVAMRNGGALKLLPSARGACLAMTLPVAER